MEAMVQVPQLPQISMEVAAQAVDYFMEEQ